MANKRLNATIAIGGTVDRSLTRGLTNTKGQLGEVGAAISKAERQQRDLSRQIKTFGRQGRSVDSLRDRYADLSSEIDRLRRRQEALNRVAAADVGGKFRTMTTEVGRLARNATIVGGAVGAGLFGISNSTAELGDNVAKTADKIGMGIRELQAYRYAAERSGIATKTFDMATQRMVRRVSEAAKGTGEAKDAIAELGLSAEALASMTPDEQMNHFADALANVENQGDRVRLAMKLFDSEGVAMVNMLRGGSEQLRQYGDEAARTGYILSEQAARDGEKFQDTLLDTQLSLAGLKNIIGADLMPVIGEMMAKFTGWLAENRDQVREWSTEFATRLQNSIPAIVGLAEGIGTVVTKVGEAVAVTANLVGGFDNLGMIIGTLIAGKAIASVVAFGGAIFQAGSALLSLSGALPLVAGGIKAIGAALMANPIGLVIGAIAGAAYLIYRNWDGLSAWFGGMWDRTKKIFVEASDYVADKVDKAWGLIKERLAWSPVGLILRAWGALGVTVGGVIESAKSTVVTAWESLKGIFAWSPLGIVAGAWAGLTITVGSIVESVQDTAGAAWDWMKEKLSWSPLDVVAASWGGLTGWFGGLWDSITGSAERALDWMTSKLEWVGNSFNAVKGWFGSDDEEEGGGRPTLGGSNAQPLNLGDSQQAAEQRGTQAAPQRPEFDAGTQQAQREKSPTKEVTQTITNHLQLHVERAGGENDATYAQRIAELVMEELNQRQQGALYDG